MATDPRRLPPGDLCRLLNSTPLGAVIHERRLYRHRTRAGLRLCAGRHIDLLKYCRMAGQRPARPPAGPWRPVRGNEGPGPGPYSALALAGRDIGDLPAVADPARKARARSDFRFFCEQYFP